MTTLPEEQKAAGSPSHTGKRRNITLNQLGRAIRRSIILFIIATILLIGAFALIINRQNALSALRQQIALADQYHIEVLNMVESEKDFRIEGGQTYILRYGQFYNDAQATLKQMNNSSITNERDRQTLDRLNNNLNIYKNTFDQVIRDYNTRGRGDASGKRATSRKEAAQFIKKILDLKRPELSVAVLLASNQARLFIILEDKQYIKNFNSQVDNLIAKIRQREDLDTLQRDTLLSDVANYRKSVTEFMQATLDAKKAYADATIAAHASQFLLPAFTQTLQARQAEAARQMLYILVAIAVILIAIFLLVIFQLRQAQRRANETLEETIAAQRAAEAENERLNDSVISILEAVNELSQRDLRARAPVTQDIIGTVSDSINALAEETARVLSGVTKIASQVSMVSSTVKNQAEQVSNTARQERESVEQMIESLFSATQVMNQVAALAEQTNESASEASSATQNALSTVQETVGGMETIRETISETEKRIKRLGERSQEISGIVNLINTISERTHVLALNASMQAAVAGEAGRGFAVVAQEVQQLAESSRHATDQIATLVQNIQIDTNETINTVNHTISQVVEGTQQAQRAGEQMNRTQEITARLVASVASIAQASQKQKNMSAQLLEAIQKIGESTEQTAQQIEAQNKETDTLQQAASELTASVNVFKLPENQA